MVLNGFDIGNVCMICAGLLLHTAATTLARWLRDIFALYEMQILKRGPWNL